MPNGSIQQMIQGFVLMVTATLAAIIVGWQGGKLLEYFYSGNFLPSAVVAAAQYMPDGSANPVFEAMSGLGVTVYYVNLFYGLDFFLGILGVLLFLQGFVKYQSSEGYAAQFSPPRGRRMRRRG